MKKYYFAAALLLLAACGPKGGNAPAAENPPAEQVGQTAPAPPAPPAPAAGECAVTAAGFCGVVWGMSPAAAAAAFPGGLVGEPTDGIDSEACFYKRRSADNYDVLFMFVDGELARVDIRNDEVASAAGARTGMTLDAVAALYPGATRAPNHYTAPAEDLIVDLGLGAFAIFEEDENGVVTRWRAGVKPPVDYVEGCS